MDIEHNISVGSSDSKSGRSIVLRLLEDAYAKPETWNWKVVSSFLLAIFLCRCIAVWSYNLWFHPLASFPGPVLGRCSLLHRSFHSLRGRYHCAMMDAHSKYGDIVRIAPNELSFASVESWKVVYGHPTNGQPIARKGPFYEVLAAGFRRKCVATEPDPKKHSVMRKILNPAFSQRALIDQEEIITGIVDRFVAGLGEKGGPGTEGLDMVKRYERNAFEILGEMAFGQSYRTLDTTILHSWAEVAFRHLYIVTMIDNLRRINWLSTLARLLTPAGILTQNQHSNYARQQVDKRLEIQRSRNDFVSLLVEKVRAGEVDKEEMTANVSSIAMAGGETIATSISAVTYFLGKNPDKLELLCAEIRTAFKSYDEIDAVKSQQLPYLQAVINETLRVFPPAPAGATRTSPGFQLHGQYIPKGAEISVSPWATVHSPKYFPDPWKFKPERWLDPDSTDNKEASRPFLLGPRDCLGRNFALMELNIMLAKILWTYDMELVDKDLDLIKQSKLHILWWKPSIYVRWHKRQDFAQSSA